MPVNMDPQKRRKKRASQEAQSANRTDAQAKPKPKTDKLDEVTERDREQALADAEWKHLWEATEVIDMDKW
ncbi:MAG: hypothetical protein FJ249_03730 [Nitrospira sp.]|nr:hypothetical protein [Nitrospira sp.]